MVSAKNALKVRIELLCAYKEGELSEKDLADLGTEQLFSQSMSELGAGECMS